MTAADREPIRAVLFDLGGVLADFRGLHAMGELTGVADEEEVRDRWLACRWVRLFESGRCSPDEFATGIISDWGLSVTPDDFLQGFRGWVRPYPGAIDLVSQVKRSVRVACLSNTNIVHCSADEDASWRLLDQFDSRFLSFETGLVKPDREAFEHAVRSLGLPPRTVLFLDDSPANVQAGRAVGMAARQVRGLAETRSVLEEKGVL